MLTGQANISNTHMYSLLGSNDIEMVWLKCAPVLGEHADGGGVVGAVGHIQTAQLGHLVQEEAPYPLLAFWKSKNTHANTQHNSFPSRPSTTSSKYKSPLTTRAQSLFLQCQQQPLDVTVFP